MPKQTNLNWRTPPNVGSVTTRSPCVPITPQHFGRALTNDLGLSERPRSQNHPYRIHKPHTSNTITTKRQRISCIQPTTSSTSTTESRSSHSNLCTMGGPDPSPRLVINDIPSNSTSQSNMSHSRTPGVCELGSQRQI